ncbi:MAG: type II toxin-antitoxin system HicA family toxin [Saprospiraceae bacterium]
MKTPRNLNGSELAKLLSKKFGYEITRQKGSHIRMTTQEPSEHHVTIPNHVPLKVGTLSAILSDIAEHIGIEREELMEILFG